MDAVEITTRVDPTFAVIWLHGLGADGNDFGPVVPELTRPHWPGVRFVFPHAPVIPVTINGGMRMRAWYDIVSFDFSKPREDAAGVRRSIASVEALIDREIARGIPSARIVLAGFSQGGAIAVASTLRSGRPLAGLIALSTYLTLQADSEHERTPVSQQIPVFMGHGRQDPVVPESAGRAAARQLTQWNMDLTWRDYAMPHSVCMEEIRDIGDWLDARVFR